MGLKSTRQTGQPPRIIDGLDVGERISLKTCLTNGH
jgi:hypothetical protein